MKILFVVLFGIVLSLLGISHSKSDENGTHSGLNISMNELFNYCVIKYLWYKRIIRG